MTLLLLMIAQTETRFEEPPYFVPIILTLFLAGALGWLIAAILGFARARAFGPSTRWFAFASVFLLLFHLQFVALGFGLVFKDLSIVYTLLTFFPLFAVLAAVCAIVGFIRLTSPR